MNLVYGKDELIGKWVAEKLRIPDFKYFRPYIAIGIQENGQIRGGVIYNNYRTCILGLPISIEISGASLDKRCALRHIIKPLFAYPFSQLKVKRVALSIAKPNRRAREFAERLGFKLEGIARNAHYTGKDSAIYSMLRHECEWLDEPWRSTISTSSTRSYG
jgi:RimJ/RimL family protein N-acetyltransferase